MKETIAKYLLEIKAVILRPEDPFIWTSGIKSPIYCDNRLTLSFPGIRKSIIAGLCEIVKTQYPEVEMLMGTATAGIPHAAIMADILDLPMGYVRSGVKKHGRENQVEGIITKGLNIVIVEDLISTGNSAIETVKALRAHGCNVLGIASIFSYELKKGLDNLKDANVKNTSLCNYDTLLKVAIEADYIKADVIPKLIAWRHNPIDESWMDAC